MAAATASTGRDLRMSAEEFKSRLESGESSTVLDVRSPKAWDSGTVKISGAIRVPPDQFRVESAWPKDRLAVVY